LWSSVKKIILRIQPETLQITGVFVNPEDYIFLWINIIILNFGLLCEQVLKKAILHRKNSLFYKTPYGAYVGDLFMSLIHTCNLCKANPFKYLKTLQDNSSLTSENPEKWMPWNYREMLNAAEE
jgi:hypothetical protein